MQKAAALHAFVEFCSNQQSARELLKELELNNPAFQQVYVVILSSHAFKISSCSLTSSEIFTERERTYFIFDVLRDPSLKVLVGGTAFEFEELFCELRSGMCCRKRQL